MAGFEYSRADGSDQFSPQSADEVFDQIADYLMDSGAELLDNFGQWQEDSPELIDLLIKRGLIEQDREGKFSITPRGFRRIENKALESLFDVRRRDQPGKHDTDLRGTGQILQDETRPYTYGDPVSSLNLQETLKNALVREATTAPDPSVGDHLPRGMSGSGQRASSGVRIAEEDLVIHDTEYQASCATVVLLDMSGSMQRYGKYGAAKRVALALQSLVKSRYQGDSLQVVGFFSYAAPLSERELLYSAPKPVSIYDPRVFLRIDLDHPPAFVPEHFTNIHAGLQFARRLLKKQSAQNRQIILITDGEPTAHLEGRQLLLIYPPAEKTTRITLAEAQRCAHEGIRVSSFALIEDYFYLGLVNFVGELARVTGGVSATVNAQNMGQLVIESFTSGRRQRRSG